MQRRLFLRTEPVGAHMRINGEDVGTSPVTWSFDHYGEILVEAEYPGHEPVQQVVRLDPPWYQEPGIDFFADVIWPARIKDEHRVLIRLPREREPTQEEKDAQIERLVENARALRRKANKK